MSNRRQATKCRVCGCGLTRREVAAHRSLCGKCYQEGAEPEKRGICEDRELGAGSDTLTHMRKLEAGDPTLLAADLEAMGITGTGDDPADYQEER